MAENLTPEERLLRVIESQGEPERPFVFWDIRTYPSLLGGYQKQILKWASFAKGWGPREISLKRIHQGLVVLLLLSGAWFAYDINRVQPHIEDLTDPSAVSRPHVMEEQPVAALRPLKDYIEEAKKRDLFSPPLPPPGPQPEMGAAEPAKVQEPPPPTPLEILRQRAGTLKLVGTSFAPSDVGTPIAIIEDTATQKTYFLKEGEFIDQVQVKSISEGRAILVYQGAQYELF